jgi:transposase
MENKTAMITSDQNTLGKMEVGRRPESIFPRTPTEPSPDQQGIPDPEVREKAMRRKYPADFKLRILKEAEACTLPGQLGALLRREGLYSSNLTAWRRQAERGTLDALSSKKRGPKARKADPSVRRLSEQEKEIQKLRAKLRKAELIIDAQKKIAEIFQLSSDQKDGEDL